MLIVSQATKLPCMIREDLSRNFGFLVNDVARLMRTVYDRRVKSLGLTRSQWWVLNHLFRNPGATQSELAAILEIERPTLGRLLDRLRSQRLGAARGRRARPARLARVPHPRRRAGDAQAPQAGLRAAARRAQGRERGASASASSIRSSPSRPTSRACSAGIRNEAPSPPRRRARHRGRGRRGDLAAGRALRGNRERLREGAHDRRGRRRVRARRRGGGARQRAGGRGSAAFPHRPGALRARRGTRRGADGGGAHRGRRAARRAPHRARRGRRGRGAHRLLRAPVRSGRQGSSRTASASR